MEINSLNLRNIIRKVNNVLIPTITREQINEIKGDKRELAEKIAAIDDNPNEITKEELETAAERMRLYMLLRSEIIMKKTEANSPCCGIDDLSEKKKQVIKLSKMGVHTNGDPIHFPNNWGPATYLGGVLVSLGYMAACVNNVGRLDKGLPLGLILSGAFLITYDAINWTIQKATTPDADQLIKMLDAYEKFLKQTLEAK